MRNISQAIPIMKLKKVYRGYSWCEILEKKYFMHFRFYLAVKLTGEGREDGGGLSYHWAAGRGGSCEGRRVCLNQTASRRVSVSDLQPRLSQLYFPPPRCWRTQNSRPLAASQRSRPRLEKSCKMNIKIRGEIKDKMNLAQKQDEH